MKLRWLPRALSDLTAIRAFIAQDNPVTARRWIGQLQERARRAALMPWAGRAVPELEREDVREVMLGAYRIVYRVLDTEVHVVTVFGGHRRLPLADSLDEG